MDGKKNTANKRGRPVKEKGKLTRSINLKLTEEDYETLKEKAESIGMKITQYARQLALNGKIKPRYTKDELDLRRKIAGMANNINQLTKKANTDGYEKAASEAAYLYSWLRYLKDDR